MPSHAKNINEIDQCQLYLAIYFPVMKKKGRGQGGREGHGGRGRGGRGSDGREGGGFRWGNNDSTFNNCNFTNNYY